MSGKKYAFPAFLEGKLTPAAYHRWLDRKAVAHCLRDRKRGNKEATRESYMVAIHEAVIDSNGLDVYTGEPLDWEAISTYDNTAAKLGGREYKKRFCRLPTVDHVGDGLGPADFKICAWRTNDCKSDLSHEELIDFCRAVLRYHETEAGSPEATH